MYSLVGDQATLETFDLACQSWHSLQLYWYSTGVASPIHVPDREFSHQCPCSVVWWASALGPGWLDGREILVPRPALAYLQQEVVLSSSYSCKGVNRLLKTGIALLALRAFNSLGKEFLRAQAKIIFSAETSVTASAVWQSLEAAAPWSEITVGWTRAFHMWTCESDHKGLDSEPQV